MNKFNKYFRIFFEGEDGGGNGGGEQEASVVELLGDEGEQQGGEQEKEKIEVEKVEAKPQTLNIDPTAFAAAMKAAGFNQAPAKVEQRQYTAEEAKKLLNVWEPDDAFVAKFGNLETQKAAMAEFRDNVIKQAVTIQQMLLAEQQEKFQAQYAPIQQHIQQQEATAREGRFNTMFPAIAKPEFRPLTTAVIEGLAREGRLQNLDETAAFKLVGSTLEALVKQTNPTFSLSAVSTAAKQTNSNALRASSSGSGGGGGGGGQAAASSKSKVVALLDAK